MTQVLQRLAEIKPQSPDWLRGVNDAGAAVLRGASWPTRKTEQWKYTSLRALEQTDYFAQRGHLPDDLTSLADVFAIADFSAQRLVFVNGIYCAALSDTADLPANVDLVSFTDANADQAAQ
jgi:Fe-S cluster assembly protein SufD